MKFYIYSLTLFLLLFCGCKQPTQVVKERYPGGQKMTEYFYPDKDDTSTYACKEYHENGRVKYETEVEDNKFIGEKKTYYENGNLQRVEKLFRPTGLDDSKYDCYVANYWPNGAKEIEYTFEDLKLNGLMVNYDSAGNKIKATEFKKGKKNGKETFYFSNGKAKRIVFLTNDILTGFEINFKESGDTLMWVNNSDFDTNGIFYKKWLENGNILVGSYAETELGAIIWRWYDKSGKQIKQKTIREGDRQDIVPE